MNVEWIGAAEAARLLGCSPFRVRQLCELGKIEGAWQIDVGGRWRIPRAAVEQLLGDKQARVRRRAAL
jgi:excisionase family DNA binding protein